MTQWDLSTEDLEEPQLSNQNLDRLATTLHQRLDERIAAVGDTGQAVVAELRGRSLGYPLHPVLVDLAGAFWTSSMSLDLLGALGFKRFRSASDVMLLAGVASSVPTVAAGLLEWNALPAKHRVRGLRHGTVGMGTSFLFGLSLALRLTGHRHAAFFASLAGSAAATLAAHLGGQLVFNHAAGQRQPAPTLPFEA